jgi:hypothetical protein
MLCQTGPKRLHQLGLSRQQQCACSEQHGKGLLLRRFDWHRAHRWPQRRFDNCLSVVGIVFWRFTKDFT